MIKKLIGKFPPGIFAKTKTELLVGVAVSNITTVSPCWAFF